MSAQSELLGLCATALFDAELNLRRAVEDSPKWNWKQAALDCANRIEPIARAIVAARSEGEQA